METPLATQIAAHVGGWTISAFSMNAAVLKVTCRSGWVGCVTVMERGNQIEMDAMLRHKEKPPANVFECTLLPTSTSDAVGKIFNKIYYHFYPMQLDMRPTLACPPWHCDERSALHAAASMICTINFCKQPVIINMSSGWWVVAFLHCHVDVRYHRTAVHISCKNIDKSCKWRVGENSAVFIWMMETFKTILGHRCQCLLKST